MIKKIVMAIIALIVLAWSTLMTYCTIGQYLCRVRTFARGIRHKKTGKWQEVYAKDVSDEEWDIAGKGFVHSIKMGWKWIKDSARQK